MPILWASCGLTVWLQEFCLIASKHSCWGRRWLWYLEWIISHFPCAARAVPDGEQGAMERKAHPRPGHAAPRPWDAPGPLQAQEANCCRGPGRTGPFSIHISLPPLSLTCRAAALAQSEWLCCWVRMAALGRLQGGRALQPLPRRWHSILPFFWSCWELSLPPAPWEPGTIMGLLSGPWGSCEGLWFPCHAQILHLSLMERPPTPSHSGTTNPRPEQRESLGCVGEGTLLS